MTTETNKEEASGELINQLLDATPKDDEQVTEELSNQSQSPSSMEEAGEVIKKKYGGLLPKKPPLISNDKEHAFFDSADWALGKVGAQKSKGPLEMLRPKLEPAPHLQTRSVSAYAPTSEGQESFENVSPKENQDKELDEVVQGEICHQKTEKNENQLIN